MSTIHFDMTYHRWHLITTLAGGQWASLTLLTPVPDTAQWLQHETSQSIARRLKRKDHRLSVSYVEHHAAPNQNPHVVVHSARWTRERECAGGSESVRFILETHGMSRDGKRCGSANYSLHSVRSNILADVLFHGQQSYFRDCWLLSNFLTFSRCKDLLLCHVRAGCSCLDNSDLWAAFMFFLRMGNDGRYGSVLELLEMQSVTCLLCELWLRTWWGQFRFGVDHCGSDQKVSNYDRCESLYSSKESTVTQITF